MSLDLSREHELRRAWLELIYENSHCLQRTKKLWIYHQSRLEADVVGIIDKLWTLVDNVSVVDLGA
jgi:hypothetical protein